LEEIKDKKIKVITIGIGTEKGGPIPLRHNGVIESFKKDQNGETVITKLYPETLKTIAKNANGGYVFGGSTKAVLDYVKNGLDNLEKTDFESQQIADFESQFQWFLGIAFLFLFIDVLFLERKTSWVKKLNLFNEEKR
jgi:Ca-activated chloride channel family protein